MGRRKIPHFLKHGEAEKILRATRTTRDRVLGFCLLWLGLRVSEATKLKLEDVDFGRRVVYIRETKGGKSRTLPIPQKLYGPLRGYVGARTAGPVFPSREGGGHMATRTVQLMLKRWAKAAGLEGAIEHRKYTPHKMRHHFCTDLLDRGTPIHVVQMAMGHSSLSSTQVYAHASPEMLRDCLE